MTLDVTENFELPLPHPDNSPRTVDVPRLRAALTAIDGLIKELQDQAEDLAEDKADKSQVAIDIANAVSAAISDLLNGAPEAYDTLKEIADKLGDNDGAVGAILSQITALQSGKADLEDGKVPLEQLPVASSEDAAAGTGDGLMKAGQVGEHVDAKVAAAIEDLVLREYTTARAVSDRAPLALMSDGRVIDTSIANASVGTGTELSATNASFVSVCYDAAHDVFVAFWRESDGTGKAAVCQVSGTTVTVGTPVTFSTDTLYNGHPALDCCYDSDREQCIVVYVSSDPTKLRTCQVSGMSLTFGPELTISGQSISNVGIAYDKSAGCALLAYMRSGGYRAAVIEIDGTSLSYTGYTDLFSGTNNYHVRVVHCEGHTSPGLNVVGVSESNNAALIPVSINPATKAISIGSKAGVGVNAAGNFLAWSMLQQALFVFGFESASGGYQLRLSRFTVSASSCNYASGVDVDASITSDNYQNFPSIAPVGDGEVVAIAWPDRGTSYYGKLRFTGLISTGAPTLLSEIQFNSGNVGYSDIVFSDDGSKGLLIFSPGSSPDTGTPKAIAVVPPKHDRRQFFIGFAAHAAGANETVKVYPPMSIDRGRSGLTRGTTYTLGAAGTMTAGSGAPRVGVALTPTELLVLGSNLYQV